MAAHFSIDGSLRVNGGAPAVGRISIAETALGFMRAFPDLVVRLDQLETSQTGFVYRWTLEGAYSATGRRVRISGYEEWTIGADGLIAESRGHFDAEEYQRQIEGGPLDVR